MDDGLIKNFYPYLSNICKNTIEKYIDNICLQNTFIYNPHRLYTVSSERQSDRKKDLLFGTKWGQGRNVKKKKKS